MPQVQVRQMMVVLPVLILARVPGLIGLVMVLAVVAVPPELPFALGLFGVLLE